MSSSPAQRLLNRRTRALLPIKDEMLRPELVTEASEQWQKKQERQAKYYDIGAIDLPELYPGDVVCMQPIGKKTTEWEKATYLRQVGPRSYSMRTEEGGASVPSK